MRNLRKVFVSALILMIVGLGLTSTTFAQGNADSLVGEQSVRESPNLFANVSLSSVAGADVSTSFDLNAIDLDKPYQESYSFTDENGELVTIGLMYEPSTAPEYSLDGSSSNPASVGTWRSYYNGSTVDMSYRFDVTRWNGQWRISNARDHAYSGVFVSFSNPSLYISRSISSSSYPAEINASVDFSVFDNAWFKIWTGRTYMYTTIKSNGTMTVHW